MARLGAGVERRRGKFMPLIEVKLFERPLENPELPKQIIETLTGLCSVIGSRRATRSGWWWGVSTLLGHRRRDGGQPLAAKEGPRWERWR
jgi:hypothetical protein